MKLVTFEMGRGPEVGVVENDRIICVGRAFPDQASTMIDLIRNWEALRPQIEALVASSHESVGLAEAHLLAPIPRPGKIMAIGLNYKDHIAESGLATPEHQLWFSKASTSAHPPYDPIALPKASPNTVDYEAELVAVIGKAGKHIPESDAETYVFGYCCGNDVSVREWQKMTPQWTLGKSFDTHAPFGPYIVTSDEVGDPHQLAFRCLVNGEVRQSSNTRHLLFNVFSQVAHLTKVMTLEPGDLIFTGTSGGVGAAMKPPSFLAERDVVRVEFEKLGHIEAAFAPE
ncbi:fumarylacetoacetate hydrolase family protein [Novosphingobium mathurense]|uniref:2-keto-4-pentenoate hydratase/2-oxohepta-3-ene-1,7-dioic acid hydratase (Catechol pathway) n=1 Tax=Novosphingobium mathurense TaxID=428990 RepID=A0A1U6IIT7_9SPHN|nr:fumarylacetoacetate hydrolase family protein [Novosphingobium mathurense]SLK07945.1 2-keto-4-pentenoate hydratase/2-oxohepta-3-ene-1,7-dioic acid hydratase (catechol pathway) [Novosphingobium mathurense]